MFNNPLFDGFGIPAFFKIAFSLFGIFFVAVLIHAIASAVSPSYQAYWAKKKVKATKITMDESREDIHDIAQLGGAAIGTAIGSAKSAMNTDAGQGVANGILREAMASGAAPRRFCKHCGAPIAADAKFCESCGEKL
ncbi:MAG: zinc ribbon domain-containing protein [Oscillospiraceae bacterium]|jgi:hypothetical protein|nr:zinc ribbon domain-containing protein [Oscillospiraceae bacterium]